MSKAREWLRLVAGACALIVLFGAVISFFFSADAPDGDGEDLPDGALVTDSAKTPWISVDKNGAARISAERCAYYKELVIPEAVNGITVTALVPDLDEPAPWIEKITFPTTMRDVGEFPFHGWDSLEQIVFLDGIEDLSDMWIGTKPSLEKLVIPASVTALKPGLLDKTPQSLVIHFGGTEEAWAAMGAATQDLSEKYTVVFESDGTENEDADGDGDDNTQGAGELAR